MSDVRAESAEDARLLETFLELVRIDSPSREERAVAEYCAAALAAAGCSVRFDDSAAVTGSDTGNLIAELPGSLPGVLLLSAHMDTVEPGRGVDPVIHEGLIVAAGDTILGADDKAGLATAIETARRLTESGKPHPTVKFLFTVQEEVGLCGAKALDAGVVAGDLCLVLDADGRPGGIVVAAPTHYTFKASFEGRAAHAGVAPELGISAIAMAADAIARMRIGRLDDRSTANIGTVSGGRATNVIAQQVEMTGECRSLDRQRVESIKAEMDSAMRDAAVKHGGSVNVAWTREYEGFELSEDAAAVRLVSRACRELGMEPGTFKTGGGSDANVIAAYGVETVALSCGMQGVHGTSEQIEVVDLERLTALCVRVAYLLGDLGDAA